MGVKRYRFCLVLQYKQEAEKTSSTALHTHAHTGQYLVARVCAVLPVTRSTYMMAQTGDKAT